MASIMGKKPARRPGIVAGLRAAGRRLEAAIASLTNPGVDTEWGQVEGPDAAAKRVGVGFSGFKA